MVGRDPAGPPSHNEALMRNPARLLLLPLLVAYPALVAAQTPPANPHAASETIPVSVRWNRLVPQFVNEAAAARRAARTAAAGRSEERRVGKECRSRWSADH